jgi:hypothetical protein
VAIQPSSFKMSRVTHFSASVGEWTFLKAARALLITWMTGFRHLLLGYDGATLDYKVFVAVLPPPRVNPSAPHSSAPYTFEYEAGDLWTCSRDNTHYFLDGTEWVRWTGGEQHHPNNESVILYQRRNGSVKWKVVAE